VSNPVFSIVTHVHNEPEFLPIFVEHYLPRVDACIVIDDGSTDQTGLEYVRTHTDWKIIRRESTEWDAPAVDALCREMEKTLPGWVMSLTVDELLYPSRKEIIEGLKRSEEEGVNWIITNGWYIIQQPTEVYDPRKPLIDQFRWGIPTETEDRIIHRNLIDFSYVPGRHVWKHLRPYFQPESSWNPLLMDMTYAPKDICFTRRLVTCNRVGQLDLRRGFGAEKYGMTVERMEAEYQDFLAKSTPIPKFLLGE
jgi:glycosyltransferase involved in cell wall biosynthesis